MENKKYKTPVEKMLKKHYEEMNKNELLLVRILSSLLFGCLSAAGVFLLDRWGNKHKGLYYYLIGGTFMCIGWYFLYWRTLLSKRKIKSE